jgi:hypothetical protein
MRQSGREVEEDKKFQSVYRQYGESGLSVFLDRFGALVLHEFEPADPDVLRLQTALYPDRKRPYASFDSFGAHYEITFVPHADPRQEHIWEVVASLDGRRLIREQFALGALRAGIIALMNGYSPDWADMGNNLPGPKRMPELTISNPMQVANTGAAAFTYQIADDYWFAIDIAAGRVVDNVARAKRWLDWLHQYAAHRRQPRSNCSSRPASPHLRCLWTAISIVRQTSSNRHCGHHGR